MASTEIVAALIMGGGALMMGGLNLVNGIRDRRQNVQKKSSEIHLDDTQAKQVAAQAASINTEDMIKVTDWWTKQFELVQDQLEIERKYRRRMVRAWKAHVPWDHLVAVKLKEQNVDVPEPPPLDVGDIEDEENSGPMRRLQPPPS